MWEKGGLSKPSYKGSFLKKSYTAPPRDFYSPDVKGQGGGGRGKGGGGGGGGDLREEMGFGCILIFPGLYVQVVERSFKTKKKKIFFFACLCNLLLHIRYHEKKKEILFTGLEWFFM